MRIGSGRGVPEALRRYNESRERDPEQVVNHLGTRVRVVVLWRQRDDDPERWTYLERMLPDEFSLEAVKMQWGGGAYRIRVFGAWDRSNRQEKYITQVAFWIWSGFPPTAALRARSGAAKRKA